MDETVIREATQNDLKAIIEIERMSFNKPYPSTLIKALYDSDQYDFIIAELRGQVLAYAITSHNRYKAHILSIAVHPSKRRKKIGKKLVAKILNNYYKLGVTLVRLEVRRSNILARKFYEDLGFRYAYTINKYYEDEDGMVYFKVQKKE